MDSENSTGAIIFWGVIIALGIWYFSRDKEPSTYQADSYEYTDDYEETENYIDRDEAIDDYWDEIEDYLTGSTSVEACTDSGCYDLETELSNGTVDTIYFDNGGYLNIGADIDNDGYASGSDDEGNDWEFTLDMDDGLVDDAVDEWATDNGYIIE